jgi:hypothetical protein
VRPDGLEVEELLRIDVPEPAGAPGAGEEAGRERGALSAVVPAPEGGDQNRPPQRRPLVKTKVVADAMSVLGAFRELPSVAECLHIDHFAARGFP